MIGVVTTSYPRFPEDSAGVFVRERVRALLARGDVVEVVAAGDGHHSSDAIVTRIPGGDLFYAGGAPETLESPRQSTRFAAWGQALGFSFAMLAEVSGRAPRWQSVESHWLLPCGLLVASVASRLPHRAHAHGGDVHLLERLPFGDSLARALCRSRPEIVFACAQLRDRFTALAGAAPEDFGARTLVEPAPIDRSLFRPRTTAERDEARAALGFREVTLLAAGRLVPIKGFDVLIAAVARLPSGTRPRVIIVGEGPERARLDSLARASGVGLILTGHLGQQALAAHMAAADALVHPCRTLSGGRGEGMPLVVREGLSRGIPVIASASGGLVELAGAPGLTLVPEEDVAALSSAIALAVGRAR